MESDIERNSLRKRKCNDWQWNEISREKKNLNETEPHAYCCQSRYYYGLFIVCLFIYLWCNQTKFHSCFVKERENGRDENTVFCHLVRQLPSSFWLYIDEYNWKCIHFFSSLNSSNTRDTSCWVFINIKLRHL